ncbi:MAG TPA: hypothetical protein VLL50_04460, partial [Usitatibacter sp.]|nr:hypothetical protein [Usitatibacter sp.]
AAPVIAHAALATHSFGTSTSASTGPSVVNVAPTTISNSQPAAPASGTGSTASGTVIAPTNTTQSDQRAAATNQAVQPERSSANTSASQIRTATTSAGSTTGTTSGGTTTGGTTTGGTTTGGTTTGVVVGSSLGFPGSVGTIVNSGEPTVDANGNIVASNAAYAVTPAAAQVAMAPPVYSSAEVAYADNTMNQVIGEAKRDRHRVGRNGQLLYSIAPRTNVDRSREVPDDGPSPALTGPLAR